MPSSQEFSLRLGAILIWLSAFVAAAECVAAVSERDWPRAAFKAVAVTGLVLIGRDIWRAA